MVLAEKVRTKGGARFYVCACVGVLGPVRLNQGFGCRWLQVGTGGWLAEANKDNPHRR